MLFGAEIRKMPAEYNHNHDIVNLLDSPSNKVAYGSHVGKDDNNQLQKTQKPGPLKSHDKVITEGTSYDTLGTHIDAMHARL